MPFRRAPIYLVLVCLLAVSFTSCFARRRLIARKGASTTQPLLTADRQTLLDNLTRQFEAVRDFNAASVEMVAGLVSLLFGVGYALHYMSQRHHGQAASPGVVMAAALPIMLGAQLLMQALNFDVLNAPTRPIHPYLRTIARMESEEPQA